jgi:hypothetical protein
MDRRTVLTTAVAAVSVSPAAAFAGGQDDEVRSIVGSWFGKVVATNPPLGEFNDLISFHGDGTVVESRRYLVKPTPLGDLLETTGHGAWTHTRGQRYAAFFRFILQSADTGIVFGTDNVRLALRLDRQSDRLVGTFVSQIRDTSDTLLLEVSGEYSAVPIRV